MASTETTHRENEHQAIGDVIFPPHETRLTSRTCLSIFMIFSCCFSHTTSSQAYAHRPNYMYAAHQSPSPRWLRRTVRSHRSLRYTSLCYLYCLANLCARTKIYEYRTLFFFWAMNNVVSSIESRTYEKKREHFLGRVNWRENSNECGDWQRACKEGFTVFVTLVLKRSAHEEHRFRLVYRKDCR